MSVTHCFGLSSLIVCRVISFTLVVRKLWYQTMLCKKNSFSIFIKSHFSIELILVELIEIVFIVFIIVHALICSKCILLFYFWIFVYCLNFLNYYVLNVSFLLCLSCVKPISWIFALIFLRVFPFLEIFQINRHRFDVIFIFRIRKPMNFFLHLLIFMILLFFLLQCISLAILNHIFLRF